VSPSQGNLTVNVQSQVRNESGSSQTVTLTAQVIDPATQATVATFQGSATALASGGTSILSASGALTNAKLWSDVTPNLYNVVTNLTVGGTIVDSRTTVTGFRQTAFKGGAGTGGVYINGRFVYLLGFAQRSSNDWAALGEAVPDWMHDYHAGLIKGSNSNYIRWMHITPQRIDVVANDKAGIVNIAPAGDKESDVTGVQWTQRTNVMRASMIYLRNNPSILFWEAGNNGITAAHMQEMNNLRTTWDPNGGRASGCRDLSDAGGAPYSQYFGTMVAYSSTWTPSNDAAYFRGYSNNYRNQSPIIECEDERDEAARRFWDKFSPPHYGFTAGANDTYHWDSESIITGDATTATIAGTLTIKGVSKEITAPVKLTYLKDKLAQRVPNMKGDLLVIRSTFTVKRSEFGINPSAPKDKVADWLESYTKIMELNYWSNTEAKSAHYDESASEWTVEVERDGQPVILRRAICRRCWSCLLAAVVRH